MVKNEYLKFIKDMCEEKKLFVDKLSEAFFITKDNSFKCLHYEYKINEEEELIEYERVKIICDNDYEYVINVARSSTISIMHAISEFMLKH